MTHTLKNAGYAGLSGLLFGLGLLASGMANPSKVVGFLDLFGAWDPSLALVMAGAIGVAFFAFYWAQKHPTTWGGQAIELPTHSRIDARLIGGGVLFGIGWGIGGFCPGPAIVAAAAGVQEAALFVAAMLLGMSACDLLTQRRAPGPR